MKVIINLLQCRAEYTGTGRYVRNICRELAHMAPNVEFIQLVGNDNAQSYFIASQNFTQIRLPLHINRRVSRIVFEQCILPTVGLKYLGKNCVLWSPNDVPILGWPGRQVVTIHDLRRVFLPEQFERFERTYYQFMMRSAARSASTVLTVSEHSRQDIHRHYGVALERIQVTYNAVDPAFSRENDKKRVMAVLARYGLQQPYVLFTGHQLQIKGPHILVEAFAQVRASYPNLTLVLVGKPGNATPLIEATTSRLGLDGAVRHLAWVQDDDLQCLYTAAQAMAFPSRYEGFGIPVLEAMHCGTPVITSRYSCLPEVAGDAAYYLEDTTPKAMAAALETVLGDSELRRELVRRGLANAARFTWQRSAQQVLDALVTTVNRQ